MIPLLALALLVAVALVAMMALRARRPRRLRGYAPVIRLRPLARLRNAEE